MPIIAKADLPDQKKVAEIIESMNISAVAKGHGMYVMATPSGPRLVEKKKVKYQVGEFRDGEAIYEDGIILEDTPLSPNDHRQSALSLYADYLEWKEWNDSVETASKLIKGAV